MAELGGGRPVRMAVVGAGWAGQRHVEALRELRELRELQGKVVLECLVDNDAAFLHATAAELGIARTYTDFRDALDDPRVDAVDLCTPHPLHAPMAIAAAEAGKHILVEKPMAVTVDEATAMIEAAERAGVRLFVAENEPYTPRARMLRDLVRSGEPIGEVTFASLTLGHRMPTFAYPGRRAWLGQPGLGGSGTWLLHGVHYVAHLRYVLGEVATVYMGEHKASSFQRRDVEGTMHGLLTLESGVQVAVAVSSETRVPEALRGYVIHGERGSLRATWERCEVFLSGTGGDAGGAGGAGGTARTILEYPEERPSAYALELEAFADYVAGAAEGPTTGRSERRSLAVVQAGYESARCGQPVRLRERFGPL